MNRIKVFGRRGSAYRGRINGWLGNNRINQSHIAVNYGLQGDPLRRYLERYPAINQIPILNLRQAGTKYQQVQAVGVAGEVVPLSWPPNHDWPDWLDEPNIIVKPYYSLGGRDINLWDGGDVPEGFYLQERVNKRRYEIRVHAFAWVDPQEWVFQKRVHDEGEDVLAWNHHNGGRFITIEEPHDPLHDRIRESVKNIMKTLGYHFGGADFIIQNPGERNVPLKHYFIEWNLATGWTLDNTEAYYQRSFTALQEIDIDTVHAMIDGMYPWEDEANDGLAAPEQGPVRFHRIQAEAVQGAAPRFRFIPRPDPPPIEDGVMREEEEHIEVALDERPPAAEVGARIDAIMNRAIEREPEMADAAIIEPIPDRDHVHMHFCPRCGSAQAQMAHYEEVQFCFQCGLNLNP